MGKSKSKETLYLTSVNYTEAGPFTKEELAHRAGERLFTWDMYVLRLGETEWHPVRELAELRQILETELPLKAGDMGPAGGLVIACYNEDHDEGFRFVEAAPFDAGFTTWHEAERLCKEFSYNGYSDWRLPAEADLRSFAGCVHPGRGYSPRTTETLWHWSSEQNKETAAAVVTQENQDKYQPRIPYPMGGYSGGYYVSEHGPFIDNKQMFPVSHNYLVRPVRDFHHEKHQDGDHVYITSKTFLKQKKNEEQK